MSRADLDITEAAAADDRRRFIETIAREIRTPLKGVVAVSDLLARQPLTADAQAYVRTITDTSIALLRRLDEALDLATGQVEGLTVRSGEAALRGVMDAVQAAWQVRATPGVTLLVSYDGEPDLAVMTDEDRLKQLFDALIGHALAVSSRGAVEVSLRARTRGDKIHLEGRVRDAGPSVEPKDLACLFNADFVRAGRANGVTLPLCRQIVRALGGEIRAEANVGPGVSVIFEIDSVRCEAAADTSGKELTKGGGAHVLVVDDNATNRMVAESLCEMFECTSESVEDGVEAVEAAKTGRFHLILMDIKMPRMDGVEATRMIRALPGAAGRVPIIALTANADPEDARAYVASGMASVVEKPIKPDRLLAAMNAAFESREVQAGGARAA